MPGTKVGGKKACETNKKKYGKDFYERIGALGGKAETIKPKGFAAMPEWRLDIVTGKQIGRAHV